jgi:hypothetical protein
MVRPDVLDGLVQLIYGASHSTGRFGIVDDPRRSDQQHAGREKALDDQIVQVPRDPVVVLHDA